MMNQQEQVKNKHAIHNPHDKMLFNTLRNRRVAQDCMLHYLPKDLLAQSNFEHMSLYKTKLVTPQWQEFQADIIYKFELNKSAGLCLFHCEHQSTPEKNMPLRAWQYILLLLLEYHENHPDEPLPVVYPLIIYTGEAQYNKSTDVFDLFGKQKAFAQKYLLKPIHLVDVCRLDDNEIEKHKLFGLSEFAFKYKQTKEFARFIKELLPRVQKVEFQLGTKYVKMIVQYIVDVFPSGDATLLTEELKSHLSKQLGEETMTIAQQLETRGIRQGLQQGLEQGLEQGRREGEQRGWQKGVQKTALEFLRAGSDPQFVSKVTGLPISKLEAMLEAQLEKDAAY